MEPPENPQESALNRACDSCRMHKVRCLPNKTSISFSDSKSCIRCLKTDRQCVFTAPQKRKQRKRTDTRVAELEKEVEMMRALFERKHTALPQHSQVDDGTAQADNFDLPVASKTRPQANTPNDIISPLPAMAVTSMTSFAVNSGTTPEQQNRGLCNSMMDMDVIDRGIVSWTTAEELLQVYITDLFPHYPAVYLPLGTSSDTLRRSKPLLFLAVIAAASAKFDASLYSTLHSEVVAAYTQRAIVGSEKSMELIQAQLVTSVWYYPPGNFSRLKYYEYIHMAVSMGLDIGLGSNPKPARRRYGAGSEDPPDGDEPGRGREDELVRRRTILVLYMLSTGVSMSHRRPNMLRTNNWITDCSRFLSLHGDPAALDHTIVAWVKLLQITEEIVSSFSFDDPGNIADLAEPQVQIMLNGYEQQLVGWKEYFEPRGAVNGKLLEPSPIALLMAYHLTQIYVHEIAIHDDHDPAAMMSPYKLEKIVSITSKICATSSYVKSTSIIISSCHSLLDCLLSMDVGRLRSLPIVNFVRMAYTVVILTKLHISSKTPTSQIGSVLDPEDIKLGYYLGSMIDKLALAVGPMECRAPFSFLGLLMRIQIWYKSQDSDVYFKPPHDLYQVHEECWLPPPPSLANNRDPAEIPGLDEAPPNTRLLDTQYSDALMDNSLKNGELDTLQPILNFEIDWLNPDLSQLFAFGHAGADNLYAGELPSTELGSGQGSLESVHWTGTEVNNTSF